MIMEYTIKNTRLEMQNFLGRKCITLRKWEKRAHDQKNYAEAQLYEIKRETIEELRAELSGGSGDFIFMEEQK